MGIRAEEQGRGVEEEAVLGHGRGVPKVVARLKAFSDSGVEFFLSVSAFEFVFRFPVSSLGLRVSGSGIWVQGFGCRGSAFGPHSGD